MNIIIIILSASLSMLIFNKINYKYNFFREIRSKIDDLDEKKERKLRIISYVLILVIYMVMQSSKINIIIQGLIFGLLLSCRETCFGIDLNR